MRGRKAKNRASCRSLSQEVLVVEKVPGWIEKVLLPKLSEIKVELKSLRGEMQGELKSINTRIDSVETKLGEMDRRLTENDRRLSEKIDDLDKRLDIVQRLSVLEAKIRDQERKS